MDGWSRGEGGRAAVVNATATETKARVQFAFNPSPDITNIIFSNFFLLFYFVCFVFVTTRALDSVQL